MIRALAIYALSASALVVGCKREDNCGVDRMVDPVSDTCVCRPEYTEVGEACIPNEDVDAGADVGVDAPVADAPLVDAVDVDSAIDVGVDAPTLADLAVTCADPLDVEGFDDRVDVVASVVNLGRYSGDAVTVRVEMLDTSSDTWVFLGDEQLFGGLGAAPQSVTVSVRVPNFVLSGANELRCIVDPEGRVIESDIENNIENATLFATSGPDLTVISAAVPATLKRCTEIRVTMRNIGRTAAAAVRWRVNQDFGGSGDTLGFVDQGFVQADESTIGARDDWDIIVNGDGGVVITVVDPDADTDLDYSNNQHIRNGVTFSNSSTCP